ncbi:hypothetical protein GUJ93_ZPchr0013g37805 [Zizania palustris]|uniref:Uncharacterized protein n=1 Tax=Zizania palustris TaxID=103762 RepID=A0A8J6C205_ZIZPA|nr:hypothetical protein GUJ93_ZPchr0013g37805 [Zizania palustris]
MRKVLHASCGCSCSRSGPAPGVVVQSRRAAAMVEAGPGTAGERVPVRAGAVDSGGHLLRHAARGEDGSTHQGRRRSRVLGRDQGSGIRQDRHDHQWEVQHPRFPSGWGSLKSTILFTGFRALKANQATLWQLRALVEYAQCKSIEPKPENVADFCIHPGEGIYGEIHGKHIYIGNRRALTRASSPTHQTVQETSGNMEGVSIGYVICDGELAGVFMLSDECRTGAGEAIRELGSLGIKSVMLTGDSTAAAKHAQDQLGGALEELQSELLPEDKVRLVDGLESIFGPTMMVGDGMNDAAALAAAVVGVSMGISGSAAAMEISHATLMSSDILRIPEAIRLGRRARRTIAVNVAFSVSVKAGVLVLAATWRPLLWAAVLADVGTSLLVVLNSMMLLREKWRGGNREDACRATARSLAMRSQLADTGAPESSADATARSPAVAAAAAASREQKTKVCHCCPKPSSSPDHSVVIVIPASGEHNEERPAVVAKAQGKPLLRI